MWTVYDVKKHTFVDDRLPVGSIAFISWERLAEQFPHNLNEEATKIRITGDGLEFLIERKR